MPALKPGEIRVKSRLKAEGFTFEKRPDHLTACIEISPDSVILSLFSRTAEWLYLEEIQANPGLSIVPVIEHLSKTHDFFSGTYERALTGISSGSFTLVPNTLVEKGNKEQFLKFNHEVVENEIVLQDELIVADGTCVFAINKNVKHLVDIAFPNNHTRHTLAHLSEAVPGIASNSLKTCLVNVHGNSLDLVIWYKKLHFVNEFDFQTSEDFLYFVLSALEQGGFPPQETEVILSGEIEPGSAIYHTLGSYLPHLRFAVHDKSIKRTGDFISLPEHKYYSVGNLFLCAS